MNVYRRFFKVTSGEMITRIKEIRKVNEAAIVKYKAFLEKIGAKEQFYIRDERMVGILFDGEPDRYLFKKVHSGWWPKKNTKKGKELNNELKAIKTIPESDCLKVVGLSGSPTIFTDGKCYFPTLVTIPSDPPILLVKIPWYDEDPEKVKKYIADKEKGVHLNRNLDAILWEPSPEMEEIKEWEYLKIIDDWNSSVELEAAA